MEIRTVIHWLEDIETRIAMREERVKELEADNAALRERLRGVEMWLATALEDGLISRGVFAELLKIDRCDVDDKAMAIKAAVGEK